MSEQLREALSAAVDGEAAEFELRRVFDELAKDDSLSHAWQSYHLIKQAAQGENVQGVADMGQRIWASLDAEEFLEQDIVQEEPLTDPAAAPRQRRWLPIGGAMVAAVALAVVVGGNFGQTLEDGTTPGIAQSPAGSADTSVVDGRGVTPTVQSAFSGSESAGARSASVLPVNRTTIDASADNLIAAEFGDDYDYGPGFIPYSELSPADQARSDGYYLHHVQHQAVNNDNVLSFIKMISYPQSYQE